MTDTLTFSAVRARQSHRTRSCLSRRGRRDLKRFAAIDRIGRDTRGCSAAFSGRRSPAHIREIKDYLEQPDAILPNPIVVAFTEGVEVRETNAMAECELAIDVSEGAARACGRRPAAAVGALQLDGRILRFSSRRWSAPTRRNSAASSC